MGVARWYGNGDTRCRGTSLLARTRGGNVDCVRGYQDAGQCGARQSRYRVSFFSKHVR